MTNKNFFEVLQGIFCRILIAVTLMAVCFVCFVWVSDWKPQLLTVALKLCFGCS